MRLCVLMLVLFAVPVVGLCDTIVVLGDSISAGYGLENPRSGWVGLLDERLKSEGRDYELINAGISGDTSAGGLARLSPLLQRHRPKILILELGANDGLRGLPPKRMQANLAQIIEQAQSAGARVLLLGMRIPPNYGKRFNDLFEAVYPALARQYGAAYVPFLLEGVGGQSRYMQPDGLHPNLDAQPLLMQQVWSKLLPML